MARADEPSTLDAAAPPDSRGRRAGYVRFELSAADGTLIAITNPVYLVARDAAPRV